MPRRSALAPPRVYLLGPFRIESESGAVRLPTRKVQRLLAYLLLHPEPQSREKLAALCWGDVPDKQARHSLRTALNMLRKLLGAGLLLADVETVRIDPTFPLWLDTREIFDAPAAVSFPLTDLQIEDRKNRLALYRGDLLCDFYDDWVLPERQHFRARYLDALLALTQELRACNDYSEAIRFARQALVQDPAIERAHQHLMFCYAALGDRTAALKQYDECQRLLRSELAVEVSPETTALYQWLKQPPVAEQSRESAITNLPVPLTPFIGRKQEHAQIMALLWNVETGAPRHRLVTLTGAGGSGKTRLAIQTATDLLGRFRDGVWWVDLSALADPHLVLTSVAAALGVRETGYKPVLEALRERLRSSQLLLLLDNCEHLVSACAQLAEELLRACPGLCLLATSREPLGIDGEQVWHVPTLSMPDPDRLPALSELIGYDAIRLFVERGAAIHEDFALTAQNAPVVARVCAQLDGIPLALELAAARLKTLTIDQIAERLVDRFHLLTNGSRTAMPRHRTLRAAVEWSIDLLSENEQLLFRRLSVFAGGWTVEAAEGVCAGETIAENEVLDLLSHLVDKSLVIALVSGGARRFRLLETLRQYGTHELEARGEAALVRERHAQYFADLAEKAEPGLRGAEMVASLERLEQEHDNYRAMLDWLLQHDRAEMALKSAGALGLFWSRRGHLREGRTWLERLLAATSDALPGLRAKAMLPAAWIAFSMAEFDRAAQYDDQALALCRETGDKVGMIDALNQRGQVAVFQRDMARAADCMSASLQVSDETGYRRGRAWPLLFKSQIRLFMLKWDREAKAWCEESIHLFDELNDLTRLAHCYIILGCGAYYEGDLDRARLHLERAVELSRQAGDTAQWTWSMLVLGIQMRLRKEFAEALETAKEGLRSAVRLGDKTTISIGLELVGEVAGASAEYDRAARLYGAAAELRRSIGFTLAPMQLAQFAPDEAAARAALSDEGYDAACREGAVLKVNQVVDYALATTFGGAKGGPP